MSDPIERIESEIILHGRRDNRAWFEPGIGVVPAREHGSKPEVFVVAKLLTGNDIGPLFFTRSRDLGRTWTPPALSHNWHKVALEDDVFEEPWFVPFYHHATDTLIAFGNTHFVVDEGTNILHKNEKKVRPPGLVPSAVYSLWNPAQQDFDLWDRLPMPGDARLGLYYAGQRLECADGSLLIPAYYYSGPAKKGMDAHICVTIMRLAFDGNHFKFLEHGSVHVVEEARGLAEPSIIEFNERFFLTVRHDFHGYVSCGKDGLHYDELRPWTFDDGSDLGNANTQQHWLKHGDHLYLVYNRKSPLNNGVFRGRAPLFMAEVDTDRLCVIKDTERVVLPENGARMGNFCIADVSPTESWVITGEWLEGVFPHSKPGQRFYVDGGDVQNYNRYLGDLLLARITWKE